MVLVKLRVRGTRDGHRTDIYQTTEEARHPEPRRRRRIAKWQALCILRSFVALRRLQDDGDFFTTSQDDGLVERRPRAAAAPLVLHSEVVKNHRHPDAAHCAILRTHCEYDSLIIKFRGAAVAENDRPLRGKQWAMTS